MSGAVIHLEPGAMRQLHWHPNADEWQYVLKGEMTLGVFASEGRASVSRLATGDVGYTLFIQNLGFFNNLKLQREEIAT